jgi:tetratricopeptide (TPR) repeat protein
VKRNRHGQAIEAINKAIALSPYNPVFFALLAAAQFDCRRWREALDAAQRGLAIDPENARCINLRAMALVKLGRRGEAGAAIDSALVRDPEDAMTHANQGWTLLHANDPRQAMRHFQEALRLDPENDWARAGIVEALKAHNPIYRVMLAYFLWIARLRGRAQWAIIVGGYIGYQLMRNAAASQPSLRPLLWPLMIAYIIFAYLTWLADPFFNLMLRVHPIGRHALSRTQTIGANFAGGLLLAAIISLIAFVTTASVACLMAAFAFFFLLIPVAGTFRAPQGWPRTVLAIYTLGLAGVLFAALGVVWHAEHVQAHALPDEFHFLVNVYVFGIIAFQFLANALMGIRVKQ